MRFTFVWLFLLLILPFFASYAQITYPEPAPLYLVTVDPETGYDIIAWYPTPSADYIEYYRVLEARTTPADEPQRYAEISAEVYDTFYVNVNARSGESSIGYNVRAIDDRGNGDIRNGNIQGIPDSTIFLTAAIDTCMATVNLTWNDYNNWRGSIAEYNIYRRLGPGIYENMATLPSGGKMNTHVLTNLTVNQPYELFVEAVHTDGRKSTSNKVTVSTHMSQAPSFMNADYATLGADDHITLSFTVDASSSFDRYNLLRSTQIDGEYTRIDSFNTTQSSFIYTDDVSFTSAIYYYKLQVVNHCNTGGMESNLANNIILAGTLSGNTVSLQWNEYADWQGGVNHYQVTRTIGQSVPVNETVYTGNELSFNDDLSSLIDPLDPLEGLVCYSIQAVENQNIYGIQGMSISNRICFSLAPEVRIPNAFIPNDTEAVNQVFGPVFTFLPERYTMIIYNGHGLKIWEGSEAWDGRVNGEYVREGVYLFYIKVSSYTGNSDEYHGSVTVLYR